MHFLFPTFLIASLAIAIPIIVHLFEFRKFKKVLFTNVRFLKELKEETTNRSKLKNLLVLLARCLALLSLVIGFAQPFLGDNVNVSKGDKSVSIFIDNSFSMNALTKDVSLLEQAKLKAKEIVQAYGNTDKFQILTNDFEGRHLRLVNKEEAAIYIDEIKIGPAVKEISKVLQRQLQVLQTGKSVEKTAYVLSDFQKNITDIQQYKDSSITVYLVPLQSVQQNNISIDSAWFESPVQLVNQPNPMVLKVTNNSEQPVENVAVTLKYENQSKPIGSINLKPKETRLDTVNVSVLKPGWHQATLQITDFPIQFDDSYFFSFYVPEKVDVLIINDLSNNKYLTAALYGSRVFNVKEQNISNINYAQIKENRMIILNDVTSISTGLASELSAYVNKGGSVLVFPAVSADISSINAFLNSLQANNLAAFDNQERKCSTLNFNEFVFNDVFLQKDNNLRLPTTKGNFKIMNKSGESIINYRDGSSFVTKNAVGTGNIFICASPLDERYNDLVRNGEIFVPMIYKMSISASKEWKISRTIGKDEFVQTDTKSNIKEASFRIKGDKDEFIPTQMIQSNQLILGVKEGVKQAGFYQLYQKKDSILSSFAFNYDRKESDLNFNDAASLKSFTNKNIKLINNSAEANFTVLVGEKNNGIVLWRWCLIFALLFLAIETALIKFFN
jgi:Aerotolerance regulator N-terminal